MQACEAEPQVDALSSQHADVTGPFCGAAVGHEDANPGGLLSGAQEAASGMLEAEDALRLVRERFQRTEDPGARGELAVEALEQVERQMQLMRERRQQLEDVEGRLWARRNRLEQFLIHTRGLGWWRARRDDARTEALATARASSGR
jgi:hypothetical protein